MDSQVSYTRVQYAFSRVEQISKFLIESIPTDFVRQGVQGVLFV
jgi:hypothetical protein